MVLSFFINPIGASVLVWGAIATVRGRCPIGFFFVMGEGLEDRGGHSGGRGEEGSIEVSNRLQHSALEGWQGQFVPPRGHSQFEKLEREGVFVSEQSQ